MRTALVIVASVCVTAVTAGTAAALLIQPGTRLTPGVWQQLSHAASRKPRAAAFTRGFLETPSALAFTVTAQQPQRVKLFWSVYCEGYENDTYFNRQGTITARAPFSGYPPLLTSASKCVLTVRATPLASTTVAAMTLGY